MRRVPIFLVLAVLFVTLLAVGAGAVSASGSSSARAVITPSPAYTADQLNAPPGDNWLTNMGSLNGNRYSSLKQIDKIERRHAETGVEDQPRHVQDQG